jgi:hypothetical protein
MSNKRAVDDLPERLDRKAQYTDRYFDNASLGEMYREAAAEIRSLREREAKERAGIVAYLRREASLEAPFGLDPMSALGLPLDYAAAMIERHEDMKPTA